MLLPRHSSYAAVRCSRPLQVWHSAILNSLALRDFLFYSILFYFFFFFFANFTELYWVGQRATFLLAHPKHLKTFVALRSLVIFFMTSIGVWRGQLGKLKASFLKHGQDYLQFTFTLEVKITLEFISKSNLLFYSYYRLLSIR